MNYNDLHLARIVFRLKLHETTGQAFQDLFVKVMSYKSSSFRTVKAQGNLGDGGCDGFDNIDGSYYQIYSPEEPIKRANKGKKKISIDFKKIRSQWKSILDIQEYYFVFNDKFSGAHKSMYEEISAIKRRHRLKNTGIILASDVERFVFELREDLVLMIAGPIPRLDNQESILVDKLTYFITSWINFERVGRLINCLGDARDGKRIVTVREILDVVKGMDYLADDDIRLLYEMRNYRNQYLHGHTDDLPPKHRIDKFVMVVDGIRNRLTSR